MALGELDEGVEEELVGQDHLAGGEVSGGVHASAGEVANAECYLVREGSVTT